MPIVASVSGGGSGCPGSPWTRYRSFTARPFPRAGREETPAYCSVVSRKERNAACLPSRSSICVTPALGQSSNQVSDGTFPMWWSPRSFIDSSSATNSAATMGQMAHLGDSSGLLIVNPHSGDGSGPDAGELARQAESRGLTVHVLRNGDDAAAVARTSEGPIGAAGGD